MLRKMLTATVVVALTTSWASAQLVRVSVGGYYPYYPQPYYRVYATPVVQAPPVEQPPVFLQPPQVVQPPPVVQMPPPVAVAPVVVPACPTGFASETFLTLPGARHFANAMSRQGYQVRVANHGLRWRVYYGPVVR